MTEFWRVWVVDTKCNLVGLSAQTTGVTETRISQNKVKMKTTGCINTL